MSFKTTSISMKCSLQLGVSECRKYVMHDKICVYEFRNVQYIAKLYYMYICIGHRYNIQQFLIRNLKKSININTGSF